MLGAFERGWVYVDRFAAAAKSIAVGGGEKLFGDLSFDGLFKRLEDFKPTSEEAQTAAWDFFESMASGIGMVMDALSPMVRDLAGLASMYLGFHRQIEVNKVTMSGGFAGQGGAAPSAAQIAAMQENNKRVDAINEQYAAMQAMVDRLSGMAKGGYSKSIAEEFAKLRRGNQSSAPAAEFDRNFKGWWFEIEAGSKKVVEAFSGIPAATTKLVDELLSSKTAFEQFNQSAKAINDMQKNAQVAGAVGGLLGVGSPLAGIVNREAQRLAAEVENNAGDAMARLVNRMIESNRPEALQFGRAYAAGSSEGLTAYTEYQARMATGQLSVQEEANAALKRIEQQSKMQNDRLREIRKAIEAGKIPVGKL
jgi:hypothetical protein